MTVRVYSPAADMVVRLKLEESADATHTVETDALTTVANQWETLTFDFSNEATNDGDPTNPLNINYVFDKLSIFFNKGVTGADAGEVIFYWDSLVWVGEDELQPTSLALTVTAADAKAVRLTGPFWQWDPNGGPEAADNGDGTWTVTFAEAPSEAMEYLWVADGVQENLVASSQDAECGYLVDTDPTRFNTDYSGYANRMWQVGTGNFTDNAYGTCVAPTTEPEVTSLALTVTAADAKAVRLTGPFWQWDPNGGPEAADNGDGTWTVTFAEAPSEAMEYLWVADGVQENLVASSQDAECGYLVDTDPTRFNTDYSGYANRMWQVGTGNFTDNAYGTCVAPTTQPEVTSLALTVTAADAKAVRLTGPFWQWDPNGGPEAADNGDGTWTVTFAEAPSEAMEYLWVADGVQENLVASSQDAECGYLVDTDPTRFNTDYSGYANRMWQVGTGNFTDNAYGTCVAPTTEPEVTSLALTVTAADAKAVRLTGPFWQWDPNGGPEAADNGDGTWTVTFAEAPSEAMEYLWVADGVQENLVASSQDAECGYLVDTDPTRFNTDYSGYANRMWQVGTGNFTDNAYGTCVAPTGDDTDSSGGDSGGDDSDTTLKAGDYYIDFSDSLEQLEVKFTQFGGTFTQFTQDPTDANKTVASTTKNATAEEWAGTTIDAGTVIFPLTETATTMTVRVYSPAADMVVRLKLEESADATHTVETDALTTVANQWETLTFDFSNEATNDGDPTNPLNINYVFDKLSIFFNKGVTGADAGEVIFYWDSLIWVGEDELQPTSLALTVTAADAKAVRLTGPFWQWDPNGGPEAADNGDGTWTVTFAEAPSEAMEYLWVADGVQENLVASSQDAECGYLVDTDPTRFNTDYSGYANRMWQVGTGNFTDNAYGTCVAPTTEPEVTSLALTVTAADAKAVRLTGPFWQWDPNGGPEAADNGDGTWTVTFAEAPSEAMEYLWVADGVQENLVASSQDAECGYLVDTDPTRFNTDYSGYANRMWQVGTGNFTDNAYGTCVAPTGDDTSGEDAYGTDPAAGITVAESSVFYDKDECDLGQGY